VQDTRRILRLFRALAPAPVLALTLAACEEREDAEAPAGPAFVATAFEALPSWSQGSQAGALEALHRSCAVLTRAPADKPPGSPLLAIERRDWIAPCTEIRVLGGSDDETARRFFETHFVPFEAIPETGTDAGDGLFTGYFEPELRGSRRPDDIFRYPLWTRPSDMVTVDLGAFDETLNGRRLVGQVDGGRLVPYHTRGAIDGGALAGRGLELLWLDDAVDVFLLHVQGSGQVVLPDGGVVRAGFAAHNGHGYVSIGRELIHRGELEPHQASWGGIRDWIDSNPDKAAALFAVNPRFIFFREIAGDGPIGSQGVALSPGRSMAVDTAFVPLGLPLWLDTTWPGETDRPLNRLVVAQDTGGAIKGLVRGDFFWGYGDEALALAGKMKSRGTYYLLVPRAAANRLAPPSS